jgi:hypothetical protein
LGWLRESTGIISGEGEEDMNRPKLITAAGIVILALGPSALTGDRFQASVNFLMGYPQNGFKTNVDRTCYGLSGEFFYQLPRSPLSVGVSLEYLNYGSETRLEPWSPDIPDVLVDVTTRNSIFGTAAVLRASPVAGFFRPYVEALAGFNYLFTYTSVNDDGSASEDIATTTNFDDWAFTYGAGAGAVIRAVEIRNRQGQSVLSLNVEAGVRLLKGRTAEYLREGSIRPENGRLVFEPLTSDTDLIKAHFGAVVRF